jgi:hypothetical protein
LTNSSAMVIFYYLCTFHPTLYARPTTHKKARPDV